MDPKGRSRIPASSHLFDYKHSPAFPVADDQLDQGLSKRELLAAQFLAAAIHKAGWPKSQEEKRSYAEAAFELADEMLNLSSRQLEVA